MPDNEPTTDDTMATISKKDLQNLRAIAKSHEEMSKEFTQLQREVTFAKAGLNDLSDLHRKALAAVLDEENFTPEAVKEAAKTLGWVKDEPQTSLSADQQFQQQVAAQLAAQNPLPPDPLAAYRQATSTAPPTGTAPARDFASEIANAQSPEAVMAAVRELGLEAHYE